MRRPEAGFQDLDHKGAYTVWNPVHFQAEYADLVRQLLPIPAHRVLLATVPHVTVAPIATGVNTLNSSPPALFNRIFTLLAPFLTRLAGTAPSLAKPWLGWGAGDLRRIRVPPAPCPRLIRQICCS